ncbi:LOW QUALITY PROTEIN: Pol protein [Phytophthora palmivora]|uniref:Pol protein n=1 Tax=Phytophthora palmivora TaxID=4796 RepID=A0A2P4XL85_9STRA|nr:LOW QUALITY PROTEIN: Pol protein [Phytophthora palmivora]
MSTLCESECRGQGSVRLTDGMVVNVPGVRMDLAVKFEDFDSTGSFLVLDMDKYDLILGMSWLEKRELWIHWRGKAIGTSRPAVSDRSLVISSVAGSNEGVGIGHDTKAYCQACGIATTASANAEGRRVVWASTVAVPDGSDQAGNIGRRAAEAAEKSAEGASGAGNIGPQVGNIGPQAGNVVPQTTEAVEQDAESASGVCNIVPHKVEETKKNESTARVSSVGNEAPRGMSVSTSRVDNQVPHSESETPPARPVNDQYHVFDGVSGRQVKAGAVHQEALPEVTADREELSMKGFLAELKAGEIAEMVLLKPETSHEDLDSSSVMDEDVLEGSQRDWILKNLEDLVYPLVNEFSEVVSKHPPSQLPPDRGVRHEIDLMGVTSDVPGAIECPSDVQWLGHTTV